MNPLAHTHPPPSRTLRAAVAVSALLVFGALELALPFRAAAAEAPARVLVINSNAGVTRYNESLAAFKETFGFAVTEFNLAASSESLLRHTLTAENPQYIYCVGGSAYQAAVKLAGSKSIILSSAINWERFKVDPKTTRVVANELPAVSQHLTEHRHDLDVEITSRVLVRVAVLAKERVRVAFLSRDVTQVL